MTIGEREIGGEIPYMTGNRGGREVGAGVVSEVMRGAWTGQDRTDVAVFLSVDGDGDEMIRN